MSLADDHGIGPGPETHRLHLPRALRRPRPRRDRGALLVSSKYTPERIEQLTTHAATRGRFASHPNLPFVLNPDFEGQNALGFRGGPVEAKKRPGAHRIVCIGASTTYGSLADPRDSYPAQLGELPARPAGSGRSSTPESSAGSHRDVGQLGLRVLPLDPDIVVILPGRNEIFPQAYNGFQADYTHFRRPGFSFVVSNYAHKELFRWSRLLMLFCTVRGERFGWSETEEHPLYGGIVWENRPTVQEALRNIEDPARMETFRRSLEGMVEMCRRERSPCSCARCSSAPTSGSPGIRPCVRAQPWTRRAHRPRQPARPRRRGRFGVPIAETAKISERPELFLDDSHLTLEGHKLQAQIVYDGLVPLMDGL
jgi:hypothetical protein